MLKLPASVRLAQATGLWTQLQAGLRAEAAQIGNAAGKTLGLNAGELREFDSSALTLLLQAARLCGQQGLTLQIHNAPAKLQELARVYGVAELLWPNNAQA
ncbi:STAS domain-containing protein [Roseateles sp. DAIF2]|uniref:STAS domain-containing protein n=1 Tax=Roseateles sp. DAIF2 TaxID=2714952 RepID=UPI0018A2A89F|nr:STAS domain-containing protein [Roseateles sp. DAIF2]QPF72555.1 STAS domain-containing protein [Roseateles sp. DAIF2]